MDQNVAGLFGESSQNENDSFSSYRGLANISVEDTTFQLDNSKIMGRKYLPEESEELETDHGLDDLFSDIENEMRSEHGLKAAFVVYRRLAEKAEEQGYVNGKRVYNALEQFDQGTDELDYLGQA